MRLRSLAQRASEPDHEQIIVLANREPYQHKRGADGGLHASRGSSGVVNAVEPLLLTRGGVWVGAAAGDADREAIERAGGLRVPPGAPRYRLRRVWLSDAERNGYYYGFANSALWPLCHRTMIAPTFDAAAFGWYELVNRKFADAVSDEAHVPAPIVFAHDYHFALAPAMIRRRLPRSRIAMFWHIPWPSPQSFERCPWSAALLNGLLGSSLVGFQTTVDRTNFLRCAETMCDVDWNEKVVEHHGRRIRVGVYPASIEAPRRLCASAASIETCRAQVRRELGLPCDATLGVGIDRMDYTKGLEEKFRAIDRLLDNRPDLRGRFTFVQIAEPSRECLPAYQQTRDRVCAIASRINARFAAHSPPIVLLQQSHERSAVVRLMRAADVCYVGSLHDGMNLVSKEFVAARDDDRGVLVLSAYAGASYELQQALLVNPYDTELVARTLSVAIDMPQPEQQFRMRRLRRVVERWDASAWAAQIVRDVSGDEGTAAQGDSRAFNAAETLAASLR
jgi:trehalose 6-phosphate synthase